MARLVPVKLLHGGLGWHLTLATPEIVREVMLLNQMWEIQDIPGAYTQFRSSRVREDSHVSLNHLRDPFFSSLNVEGFWVYTKIVGNCMAL